MNYLFAFAVTLFFAVLAGVIAFAVIDSKFPEFSKRGKERVAAAAKREGDG